MGRKMLKRSEGIEESEKKRKRVVVGSENLDESP